MASSLRFVDLSGKDIIKFCEEQENKNVSKNEIPYYLFQGIPCNLQLILDLLLCLECFIN